MREESDIMICVYVRIRVHGFYFCSQMHVRNKEQEKSCTRKEATKAVISRHSSDQQLALFLFIL